MPNDIPLQYGAYYHIYNRGNNGENIFREERNYLHFLKLYASHVEPIADTFAYCLLKNHFHLLVRIGELDLDPKGFENPSGLMSAARTPSQAFSNLFNAYTKAINKAAGRTGSLFEHPFSRLEVSGASYFRRLITYIHQNPQRHGFVDDFRDWKYSSYHALTSTSATRLKRETVINWFGTLEGLALAHQHEISDADIAPLAAQDLL